MSDSLAPTLVELNVPIKVPHPHPEPAAWSAEMVRAMALHPLTVRMYADAPYAAELFSESTWQQLAHPQYSELYEPAPPIVLSKGRKRYYLPGSARDLVLHTSSVASLFPALARYLDDDHLATDLGPPLHADLCRGSLGTHHSMANYWAMVDSRTQEMFSAGFSHVLLTDIKRCIESVDTDRLSSILKDAQGDEHSIRMLEHMHQAWGEQGCQGLPLSAGFLVLIKPYFRAIDARLRDEGISFVRLQDDYRVFCHSHDEASAALSFLESAVEQAGFSLNYDKTLILEQHQFASSLRKKWLVTKRMFNNGVLRPLLSDALQQPGLRQGSLRLLHLLYSRRWQSV